MTKYILQGGGQKEFSFNKYINLWKLLKQIPIKSRVLMVFFAKPKEEWKVLSQDAKKLRWIVGRWDIDYVLASDDQSEFIEQIKECEVIYFRGGDTPMLQKKLEEISSLKELLGGKIVIGSSAGAIVFAKYYYDQDYDQVFEGLSFLPIKIITHYQSTGKYASTSGEDKLKMLEDYKEKLPIYAIREGEFVLLEK